jgi:hypothetical protein
MLLTFSGSRVQRTNSSTSSPSSLSSSSSSSLLSSPSRALAFPLDDLPFTPLGMLSMSISASSSSCSFLVSAACFAFLALTGSLGPPFFSSSLSSSSDISESSSEMIPARRALIAAISSRSSSSSSSSEPKSIAGSRRSRMSFSVARGILLSASRRGTALGSRAAIVMRNCGCQFTCAAKNEGDLKKLQHSSMRRQKQLANVTHRNEKLLTLAGKSIAAGIGPTPAGTRSP